MYTVYILKSRKTGRYYTGSTEDLDVRLRQHNGGGNWSTRAGIPWEIVHREQFGSRSEALTQEKAIKARGAARYLSRWSSESQTMEDVAQP